MLFCYTANPPVSGLLYPMLSINFIVVTLIGQFIYKETVNEETLGIASDYARVLC